MRRETLALQIKPGAKAEFRQCSSKAWPEIFAQLDNRLVQNLSFWCVEDLVFGYCEVHGEAQALLKPFYEAVCETCKPIGGLHEPMRLMYEDIGFIREDKSKITHRVFVTRLKPECREEYKHRHDVLTESRGGRVNPGPESNFTIWNGGDYIFGYCEMDKAMLQEPTEEERKATIAWESSMLEIMDWITDDVDWLTGLNHSRIKRLFA